MPDPKRIAAIIQARMSSSRLPGKVMLDLAGQPVLWHVFHRLRKCRNLTHIILATSTDACDDQLASYAVEQGIDVVRGSRDNVLSRFAKAVDLFDPDYIVRITSDCPLLDPDVIDAFIDVLIAEDGDYCGWIPHVVTLHGGFEPVSRRLFERILDEGSDHPVAQEHVIGYLAVNPDIGKRVGLPAPQRHVFDEVRLWLDTPADLKLLRTLYARTGAAAGEIGMDDVAELLHTDPSLRAINIHVRQKVAFESSRKVIMRCDGDARTGMGHISRMLAVAGELRERYATAVHFAVMSGPEALSRIEQARFPILPGPQGESEVAWLDTLITNEGAHACIMDIRTDLPAHALEKWRTQGVCTVLIDDIGSRLEHADFAFCPPTPLTLPLNGKHGSTVVRAGWEWLILDIGYAYKPLRRDNAIPRVLVSCGSSDPEDFTRYVLAALDESHDIFEIDIIQGKLYPHKTTLAKWCEMCRHPVRVYDAPESLAPLMAVCDIGIFSFGVTASEAASMGLPSLYLCLSDDHALSASTFEKAGFGISLGRFTPNDDSRLIKTFLDLLNDPDARSVMSHKGMETVDGLGARRIAEIIADRIAAGRPNMTI